VAAEQSSLPSRMRRIIAALLVSIHVLACDGFVPSMLPGQRGLAKSLRRFPLHYRQKAQSVLQLQGSFQRNSERRRLKTVKSKPASARPGRRESSASLAVIEPLSALSLIAAPSAMTPFQQRLTVAAIFSIFVAFPSTLPASQTDEYRRRLSELRQNLLGSGWLSRPSRLNMLMEKHYAFLAVVAASCLPLLFGLAIGFTSPCLTPMCIDMSLSTAQASSFASVLSIGAVSAAFLGMREVNRLGRKPVLVMTAAFYAAGYLLITMGSMLGYWGLLAGRFLTGVGAGLANVVTPMYIAEISPAKLRGLFGTFYQLATCAGILLMYILGATVDWRVAAATGAVMGAAIAVVGQAGLPETPAYLVQRGKEDEAKGVLCRLVQGRTQAEAEELVGEMKKVDAGSVTKEQGASGPGRLAAIFKSKSTRRSLGIISLVMCFQQFTGINSVIYFSSQILDSAGFGVSAAKTAIGLALAQMVGTAYSASQADARNRRTVLLVSGAGMAVGMAMISLFFAAQAGWLAALPLGLMSPEIAVAGLLVYILLFSVGWGPVPWLLVSELFPPQKRPMATGLCTVLAWGGTFVITQGTTTLLASAGPAFVFSGFLLATLLSLVWVASPLFLETKGRSLAQIQQDLKS